MSLQRTIEVLAASSFSEEEPADFFTLSQRWSPAPWFKSAHAPARLATNTPLPEFEWEEPHSCEGPRIAA